MKGIILVPIMVVLIIIGCTTTMVCCKPQVPCYFIFGDSLSDAGNNNHLNSTSKANYPPYGIDWPGGIPTGRYSNGRTIVDRIGELLGFDEYIPPYRTATGKEILKGVNYASGSAGILSETGQHVGERISLDEQLVNHALTTAKFLWYGKISLLGKCLYTVNMGSNDYINYFMPGVYPSSYIYTPDEYADHLIRKYATQLKTLHLLGGRKIAVFGLSEIGCAFGEIDSYGTKNGSKCVDKINSAVEIFNQKLISLVDDLNFKLPGAQFTFIADTKTTDTGSLVTESPCCDVTKGYSCRRSTIPCKDRNNYVFWDGFHTTELMNVVAAETVYNTTDTNIAYPVSIKTLVESTYQGFLMHKLENRISNLVNNEKRAYI